MSYTATTGSWGVRRSAKSTLVGVVIGALAAALFLPSLAYATVGDDAVFSADTTVTLDNGISLTISSGSEAESVVMNTNTLTVTMVDTDDSLTLVSANKYRLTNDGGKNSCLISGSTTTMTFTGTGSSVAVAVTPETTVCATGSTGGGGGGGGGGAASTTPTISLSAPSASTALIAGKAYDVSWTTGGSGISTVELRYSTDGGIVKNLIATNLSKSSPYSWTVPSTLTGSVMLLAYGHDSGKSQLASSTSTYTVVKSSSDAQAVADQAAAKTDAQLGITRNSANQRVSPSTGTTGPSPATGKTEAISKVEAGWYVRGFSYPTIYYVTSEKTRRPFWDGMTYFTWSDKWDNVVWVTDATLATLPLGAPMLPKPGAVTVKIQSDPKVYAIENDPAGGTKYVLRWVPTEAIAKSLYGTAWSDYIIDLEPTTFSRFQKGGDMIGSESVTATSLRSRTGLGQSVAGSQ